MKSKFQAGVPLHCPPADASSKATTLYRFCKESTAVGEDFTSHMNSRDKNKRDIANKRIKRDPTDCKPSGLSVYTAEKDILYACKFLDFTWGKYIFAVEVADDEGRLKQTGDYEHHTYWPLDSVDLLSRAKFVCGPIGPPIA